MSKPKSKSHAKTHEKRNIKVKLTDGRVVTINVQFKNLTDEELFKFDLANISKKIALQGKRKYKMNMSLVPEDFIHYMKEFEEYMLSIVPAIRKELEVPEITVDNVWSILRQYIDSLKHYSREILGIEEHMYKTHDIKYEKLNEEGKRILNIDNIADSKLGYALTHVESITQKINEKPFMRHVDE